MVITKIAIIASNRIIMTHLLELANKQAEANRKAEEERILKELQTDKSFIDNHLSSVLSVKVDTVITEQYTIGLDGIFFEYSRVNRRSYGIVRCEKCYEKVFSKEIVVPEDIISVYAHNTDNCFRCNPRSDVIR
jgi:MoxR-like ATPase